MARPAQGGGAIDGDGRMTMPVDPEPTMEEVLASIRRIIAQEHGDDVIASAVLRNARPPVFSLSSGAIVVHTWGNA